MGTAYINCDITAVLGGVTLFQIEAVAEVEYEVDAGDLTDWRIRDFKFEEFRTRHDSSSNTYRRVKIAEAWCPDVLRPTLMEYVDRDTLEQDLVDQLMVSGEMYCQSEAQRRSYHSAVL